MRHIAGAFTFAVIIASAPFSVAVPLREKPDPKRDLELIQGRWQLLEAAYGGKQRTYKDLAVWTITKSHIVYDSNRRDAYQLVPTAKPKEFDLTATVGEVSKVLRGIYELNGNSLRISIAFEGRPTDFASGTGCNVFKLRRLKSK